MQQPIYSSGKSVQSKSELIAPQSEEPRSLQTNSCPSGYFFDTDLSSTNVRLTGGKVSYQGRLEVFRSGAWIPVLDVPSNRSALAQVACAELKMGDMVGVGKVYHNPSELGRRLFGIQCSGSESEVDMCPTYLGNALRDSFYWDYHHYTLLLEQHDVLQGLISKSRHQQ